MRRLALLALSALLAACSGTPILANPPVEHASAAPPIAGVSRPPDPRPVSLPADDAPHDGLTEWWYYTGHLVDAAGGHWGFEDVVFRAERGDLPVSWASHVALTDETGRSFHYDQRTEIGPQVATTDGSARFAFDIAGDDAEGAAGAVTPWRMTGGDGHDHLSTDRFDLDLVATKPPALHDRDGWIDFGPAGGSYYYSRTNMAVTGSVNVGAAPRPVTGTAWFDHQWGDFIAVGGGGWDWFAVNLADRTDLTLSLVRATDGSYPLVYGTLVGSTGASRHLARDEFTVTVLGSWTSSRTGARYPAGWTISLPAERLELTLRPTVADQELDTRATTGVVYWEGSQTVSGTRAGTPITGEAYVELTGYGQAR